MEILELTGPIRGGGLRALAAHRKLRVLRIELPVDSDFEVPASLALPTVEHLG